MEYTLFYFKMLRNSKKKIAYRGFGKYIFKKIIKIINTFMQQ